MFQQYSCLLVLYSHQVLVQLETRSWSLKVVCQLKTLPFASKASVARDLTCRL